jgi:hypothetical protein
MEHRAATKPPGAMVGTQALTMCPATAQRTFDAWRTTPASTVPPAIVFMADTPMPSALARNRLIAPPDAAQNPPTALGLVIGRPRGLPMRQPLSRAPGPIASSRARTEHPVGRARGLRSGAWSQCWIGIMEARAQGGEIAGAATAMARDGHPIRSR